VTTPRLFFLGKPRFELGKRNVELSAAKAIALLGYLAATREPQTREHLLGLLWAESADNAARKNLRNALWAIRKALGEDAVLADDDRLAINENAWIDVREFEKISDFSFQISDLEPRARQSAISHLQSVIALYRAPFLDGLTLSDASEFEIWLTAERERLAQLNLRALAALVDAYQRAGDWRAVIETAQRALAQDPLQEPMHRALMEAHARLGERPEALRQYDTLRATLERELGVAPLPETEALRAAILNGELMRAHSRAPLPTLPKRAPIDKTAAPYIGRRAERAALDEELDLASRGSARVVLLTGEIGIGKSRLWQEWSATLSTELTVLSTRCLDSTQALPFAPLIELFGRCQKTITPPSSISPIWLAEIARLLPEVRQRFPGLPAPAVLPPDEERRRVFEAFAQILLALARPIVLFVDDAHWADQATLDWLGYLAHAMRDQALLLIVAYRAEDAPASLARLAAGWGREGIARRVPLARLTNAESAALIVALGGNPAIAERVHSQTAGNPYFLIELLRGGTDHVPQQLTELIRARLNRLPESAQQVLQAAAVLAPEFDFGTLRRTSGRDEEETLQALDALLGAAVLTEKNSHYEFAHPLVATVVQDDLSGARCAFLHRRAAEALETVHAGRLPQIAGQLAAHYAAADDPPRAARFAEMAAERALGLAATNAAENFYRQAIALEDTPARQMGLGRVLMREGEVANARQAFELALREYQAADDRKRASRAALNIAETWFPQGRFDEGREWIEKGIALMADEGDSESHAMAHLLLGYGQDAEQHLNAATAHAVESHLPDIAARSQFILGNQRAERGDLLNALEAFKESIRFSQAAGDEYQEILGYNNLAYHALLAGDLAAAHENIDKGLALAQARAIRLPLQYLYSTRGEIALAEKQWDGAETWFRRGLAEAETNGNVEVTAGYHAKLALVARGRGDLDSALTLLESARESASQVNAPFLQAQIELWLAELYLQRGERTAASQTLARADARLAGTHFDRLKQWAEQLRGNLISSD
jgi:DNA-binding SARP family transcriptional activator